MHFELPAYYTPSAQDALSMNACLQEYDKQQVQQVRPWVYGNLASGIVYGAITVLYLAYIQLVRKQYPKFDLITPQSWMLLIYATLTFALCTLAVSAGVRKTVDVLMLENCNWTNFVALGTDTSRSTSRIMRPGGLGTLGNISFMLTSWTADALLIWRYFIIYYDVGSLKWAYVTFPVMLEITSIVLGSRYVNYMRKWPYLDFNTLVYYESTTFTLNFILTVLIIVRLFVLRYRVRKVLGASFGTEYTNVAAMLTESQAMTLVAQAIMIAFIVREAYRGGTLIIYQILSQVQALAPMLIIYRVAQGKAWSINAMDRITKTRSFGDVE